MRKFKVCLLGAFAVGKTSLIRRFVYSLFDGRYQTTLGVKIDKKSVQIDGQAVELMLWDLAGEDDFIKVPDSYLRGSAGAILVADGSRAETLQVAIDLRQKLESEAGQVPIVLLVNKSDLRDRWNIDRHRLDALADTGLRVIETSALTGNNVNRAFGVLTQQLLATA